MIRPEFAEEAGEVMRRLSDEVIQEGRHWGIAQPFLDAAGEPIGLLKRRVMAAHGWMARGLFMGFVESLQQFDVAYVTGPAVARAHPGWSRAQLEGEVARKINLKYSTLPDWQTIVHNPQTKAALHDLFFSSNEFESHMLQVLGVLPFRHVGGKEWWRWRWAWADSAFWRKHWMGMYFSWVVQANALHILSTGEPLPLDRYSPIRANEGDGAPFTYNTRFMSPDLPFLKGRGRVDLALDLVNQADTVFRLMQPDDAFRGRLNVVTGAGLTQALGYDYWRRPLEGPADRALHVAQDVLAPIGVGHALAAFGVGVEGEQRLGLANLVQSAGFNLRAATNQDLRDAAAVEHAAALRPAGGPLEAAAVTGYDDLEPAEKVRLRTLAPTTWAELDRRGAEQAEQVGAGGARARAQQNRTAALAGYGERQAAIDAQRWARLNGEEGGISGEQWRDLTHALRMEKVGELRGIDRQLGDDRWEPGELTAIDAYLQAVEDAKDAAGVPDWDLVDLWLVEQDADTRAYIDRNTGLNQTEMEKARRTTLAQMKATGYFAIEERVWAAVRSKYRLPDATYSEWRDRVRAGIIRSLRARDPQLTPESAEVRAEKMVNATGIAQDQQRAASAMRTGWVRGNPQVARATLRWDYFVPTGEAEAWLILLSRATAGADSPPDGAGGR